MDLDFFDNPTVKKGIAVMFWQFSLLQKLPDFWEMNPRTFGLPITKYAFMRRIIAIRTIRNTFFDYWIVKKKHSLSSSHESKWLTDMSHA
jgi:hypothetical protein